MADELHDIVQRMLDAGETEDTIATVIKGFPAATPSPRGRMEVSRVADPEGGLALADVAEQSPRAAITGAAAGLAAPFVPVSALAAGAGRLLSRPSVSAAVGGFEGYRRGGIGGGLEGAVLGAIGGPLLGKTGRLLTALRGASAPAVSPSAARAALSALPNRIIQSPEGFAMRDRLMTLAKEEASRAGMVAAGTQARGRASLL